MDKHETAAQIVDEVTDKLAAQVAQGLLLRNARKRLLGIYEAEELVEKLLRIIEIKADSLMHYVAR